MNVLRRASVLCGLLFFISGVGCSDAEPPKKPISAAPTGQDPPGTPDPSPTEDGGTPAPLPEPSDAGPVPPDPPPDGDAAAPPQCGSITAFPSIVEQASGTSTQAQWNDVSDVTSVDGQGASVVLNPVRTFSRDMFARGFGFAVPAGMKIVGVRVEITRQTSADDTEDAIVQLSKKTASSSSTLGDNQRRTGPWPTGAYYTATYGSASSRWGASLSPTTVNAASFAVQMSVLDHELFGADEALVRVDGVKVTVHYCP